MGVSFDYNKILNNSELEELHNKNNKFIITIIEKFRQENNLAKTDFVIGGSSCASYMNYLILKRVNDVDIFLINPNIQRKKTSYIDILRICFAADGWQNRVIEKDGYLFLAPEDFLLQECAGALIKGKLRNIEYVGRMLKYLNLSSEQVISMLQAYVPTNTSLTEEWKEMILNRMQRLCFYFPPPHKPRKQVKEENNGSNQTD